MNKLSPNSIATLIAGGIVIIFILLFAGATTSPVIPEADFEGTESSRFVVVHRDRMNLLTVIKDTATGRQYLLRGSYGIVEIPLDKQ